MGHKDESMCNVLWGTTSESHNMSIHMFPYFGVAKSIFSLGATQFLGFTSVNMIDRLQCPTVRQVPRSAGPRLALSFPRPLPSARSLSKPAALYVVLGQLFACCAHPMSSVKVPISFCGFLGVSQWQKDCHSTPLSRPPPPTQRQGK